MGASYHASRTDDYFVFAVPFRHDVWMFLCLLFSVSSEAKLIPGLSAGLGRLVNSQRVGSGSRVDCTSESSKKKGENLKKLPIALLDVIGSFCTIL